MSSDVLHIFISHSQEEAPLGNVIKYALEEAFQRRLRAFLSSDPRDNPGGAEWLKAIQAELQHPLQRLTIAVRSHTSQKSRWADHETGAAWALGHKLFPLCHGGLLPGDLGRPLSDFGGVELESPDAAIRLIMAVEKATDFTVPAEWSREQFLTDMRQAAVSIGLHCSPTAKALPPIVNPQADWQSFPRSSIAQIGGYLLPEQIEILQTLVQMTDEGHGAALHFSVSDVARASGFASTIFFHHASHLERLRLIEIRSEPQRTGPPGSTWASAQPTVRLRSAGAACLFEHNLMPPAYEPAAVDTASEQRGRYASCSQIAGGEPHPADDVYALGVLTYELLTGRHPFEGTTAIEARDRGMTVHRVTGLSHRQWRTLRDALDFRPEMRPSAGAYTDNLATPGWSILARFGGNPRSKTTLAASDAPSLDQPPTLLATNTSPATVRDRRMVGTVLNQKYRLEALIGRDAHGASYRAYDLAAVNSGRTPFVAIRILDTNLLHRPEILRAFQRESKKAHNLAHPNVVTLYGLERDGSYVFIVTELLEGSSLDRIIDGCRGRGGMPHRDALRIARQLGSALAYGHERGFVFGGLCANAVVVTKAGVAKIRDSGLARVSRGNPKRASNIEPAPEYLKGPITKRTPNDMLKDDAPITSPPRHELLDVIEVETPSGVSRIELHSGDLTSLVAPDAVDTLVISAYPDSYWPVEGSLIRALSIKGISLADLAARKQADLRANFSCWLSEDVPQNIPGIQFKRILCFESARTSAPEAVGDIFRALAPFVAGEPRIASIAMPIVATGSQGYEVSAILPALVQAAVEWLTNGLPLRTVKIYAFDEAHALQAMPIFAAFKARITTRPAAAAPNYLYDAFISYAREDREAAMAIAVSLKAEKLRVFLDELELDHGIAWQQQIFDTLDKAKRVIAIYSAAYIRSKVCQEEFNIAWARGRKLSKTVIYPVYWQSGDLPTYMELLNYADCRERRSDKLAGACQKLVDILR